MRKDNGNKIFKDHTLKKAKKILIPLVIYVLQKVKEVYNFMKGKHLFTTNNTHPDLLNHADKNPNKLK